MRAFLASLIVMVVVAIGGYYLLGDFQHSAREAFTSQSARP